MPQKTHDQACSHVNISRIALGIALMRESICRQLWPTDFNFCKTRDGLATEAVNKLKAGIGQVPGGNDSFCIHFAKTGSSISLQSDKIHTCSSMSFCSWILL